MTLLDAVPYAALQALPPLTFSARLRGEAKKPLNVTVRENALAKAQQSLQHTAEPIRLLYTKKFDEYALKLRCLAARQAGDHITFVEHARRLFPVPEIAINDPLAPMVMKPAEDEVIDAEELGRLAQRVAAHHGFTIDVVFHDGTRARVTRRGRKTAFRIPRHRRYSTRAATRLLIHEIEVHALRTHRAMQQPLGILLAGTAAYLATEEGLAMHLATPWQAGPIPGIRSARAAAAGKSPKPEKGMSFLRRHIYYTGRIQVTQALKEDPALLGMLFVGHVGLDDIAALHELDIEPAAPPELISEYIVRQRVS